MKIITDSKIFTQNVLNLDQTWQHFDPSLIDRHIASLLQRLLPESNLLIKETETQKLWEYALITEHANQSQFEILKEVLSKKTEFKEGILCLAGSGQNFKGYRNRKWESLKGNIHLSLFLNPNQPVRNFHTGFTIISAISVVQTIDSLPGMEGKAAIKWVNDIMIDGGKVSGVLTQTQTQGNKVNGVFLGIGLNVKTTPTLQKDLFVPQATSLCVHTDCTEADVLPSLLGNISRNYKTLIDGGYDSLLNIYRQRSLVIGKKVTIYSDPIDGPPQVITRGKVQTIGENLELYLQGIREPVTRGRIIFNS